MNPLCGPKLGTETQWDLDTKRSTLCVTLSAWEWDTMGLGHKEVNPLCDPVFGTGTQRDR